MKVVLLVAVGFVLGAVAEMVDRQFKVSRLEWEMLCVRLKERERKRLGH